MTIKIQESNKPSYIGHRSRIKEKFLKSSAMDFYDYELLEILLFSSHPRVDVKNIAKKLLQEFGSIKNIINADVFLLKSRAGLNDSAIVSIKIVKEIILRCLKQDIEKKIVIESWKALLDYCQLSLSGLKHEQLRILFLNKNHQLIADELHYEGNIENIAIDPVSIVKKALLASADSLILIHNHPSGNVQPSRADLDNTNKIASSLKVVNIKIHDHLIIGEGNYYSFRNNGLI